MSRPENQLPAEYYYNEEEAKKYSNCTRIIEIQTILAERCLDLLDLQEDNCLLLDIGCGSGLSGDVLTENMHYWVGLDISRPMMNVAIEREIEGDLFENDVGQGFHFRPGVFDGAISVSAIQWLCVAGKKSDNPHKRILKFFKSLYTCLRQGAKAALQIYPENAEQIDMLTMAALKAGFTGGVLVDFPHSTKAKKFYLVITAGDEDINKRKIVQIIGKTGQETDYLEETKDEVSYIQKSSKTIKRNYSKNKKPQQKSKEWIINKKEKQRNQGKEVRQDSKYTGRRRQSHRL